MNIVKALLIFTAPLAIAACGNFEWFPSVIDTTPPNVTATIAGNSIFNNHTTHVTTGLPATVTFFVDEPATIFYTTNNDAPTTSSPSVVIPSAGSAAGPVISVSSTILKFFGIDSSANKNSSAIQTSTIVSP